MSIKHWYQLHRRSYGDEDGYRDEFLGPFKNEGLMEMVESLAAPVPDHQGQIPTQVHIVRLDLKHGASYRAKDGKWNRVKKIRGLDSLPERVIYGRDGLDPFWDLGRSRPQPALVLLGRGKGICEVWRTLESPSVAVRRQLLWTFCDRHLETEVTALPAIITVETTVATDLNLLASQLTPAFREKTMARHFAFKTEAGKPLLGYRTWLLHVPSQIINHEIVEAEPMLFGPQLYPNQASLYEWKEAEKVAICVVKDHRAPDPKCDCGVYARHEFDWTEEEFGYGYGFRNLEGGTLVRGAVLGSGDALIYDRGWRAESARVIGFDLESVRPAYLPALQLLARKFDVPIVGRKQLEELALKRGRVLHKRDLEGI